MKYYLLAGRRSFLAESYNKLGYSATDFFNIPLTIILVHLLISSSSIRSASAVANLQAGAYYYFEAIQLSSDKKNKLTVSVKMTCAASSTDVINANPIPQSFMEESIPSKQFYVT